MWTALVLACISSLSLSESRVAPQGPGPSIFNQTQDNLVTRNASGETTGSLLNKTSAGVPTPSPVTLAKGALGASRSFPTVTAGRTHRTDVGASAAAAVGPTNLTAPVPPSPVSTRPAVPSTATPSTPKAQVPHNGTLPTAAPRTMLGTSTQTAAATTASAGGPTGAQSPAQPTPHHSTASPTFPTSPNALTTSTQGPTIQPSIARPLADTGSRPALPLENTTLESTPSVAPMSTPSVAPVPTPSVAPVSTPSVAPMPTPSVAPMSTTAVTATMAQATGPAASTVPAPVPHASPTPRVEATSPKTTPSPVSSPWVATGPSTPPTPEQVPPEATGGTASTGTTAGSSGHPQMPTTDSCQLSTQSQYLVVTSKPLALVAVNRGGLLAMLLLGVTLFCALVVLFALQAYENYKKKDYTQVDYLINGMYADSEM